MDDAQRVRLGERLAGLEHVVDGRVDRQRTCRCGALLAEVAALEVLHHHVRRAVVELADVDHARECSLWMLAAARASRRKRASASSLQA